MSAKRRWRIGRGCGLVTGAVVCAMTTLGVSTAWASSTGIAGLGATLTAGTHAAIGGPPAQLAQSNPQVTQDRPPAPEPPTQRPQRRNVERSYELTEAKADALFELLKFDDVKVLVGKHPGGAHVRGSAREMAAIDQLIDLITRDEDRDIDDVGAFIEEMRPSWTSKETHQLPQEKAQALYTLLAFKNVPVLVSMVSDGIHIEATEKDQRTINDVARILRGEQPAAPMTRTPRVEKKKQARREPKARQREQVEHGRPRAHLDDEQDKRAEHHHALLDQLRELHSGLDRQVDELHRHADRLHAEVERRAQELHAEAEQLHAEAERIRRDMIAAAERLEKELDAFREELGDAIAIPKPPERNPAPQPRASADRQRNRPDKVVTRSYELPAEHAEHLFALLAPNDIDDVIVSREGNVIQIRASVHDQETIKRLVELLTRGTRN